MNKKNKELMDIEPDESEAPIVRLIFEKTVRDGYGSHRMADLLNRMGIKTHNGSKFQCNTINRILANRAYCGYYISGSITSPFQDRLQIIDESLFDQAQRILEQRAVKKEQKQQIARTTKGKTLLSGNIYCAHCGPHMIATSYVDSHSRIDGSRYEVRKQRYICYNKNRKRGVCDGQSAYVSTRIDEAVELLVKEFLARIQVTPKSIALERRYRIEIAELKAREKEHTLRDERLKRQFQELSFEIGRSLVGESKFTPDTLALAMDNAKMEMEKNEQVLIELNYALRNQQGAMKNLNVYYEQFQSWAEEFEAATLEQKKMIICQLVSEIRVSRGYVLEVVLDVNYEQFLAG